jgi:hypothetical protein
VGTRLHLEDFTLAQLADLNDRYARPLKTETEVKQYQNLVSGHPYLTQRLCHQLAGEPKVDTPQDVDRVCGHLFLSHRALERDDNLIFVRERMLRSEADVGSVLDLYATIQHGKRVNDDDTNPLVSILRLAGITKVEFGALRVRNRIYERVFDRHWITTNLPDAEVERQRRAYRRGLWRATAISVIVIVALLSLVLAVYSLWQRQQTETHAQLKRRELYAAQMNLVGQAWEVGNVLQVQELLQGHVPAHRQEDLRGFEWFYYWRLSHQRQRTLPQADLVQGVAFAPDGKWLATASDDHTIKLWEPNKQQELQTFKGHTSKINCLAYAPNGKWLATGSDDETVRLWDVQAAQEVRVFKASRAQTIVFSPDSQRVAAAGFGAVGKVWDISTGQEVFALKGFKDFIWSLAYSPDGSTLVAGGEIDTVKLFNAATGQELSRLKTGNPSGRVLAFAPDGKTLAVEQGRINIVLFDVEKQTELHLLKGHTSRLISAVFSPDNKRLATGSADGTVKLWDPQTGLETATFRPNAGKIFSIAFAPDGQTLAVACQDRTVKLWRAASREEVRQQ